MIPNKFQNVTQIENLFTNNDPNTSSSAGAGGDPHIKPLLGKPYSLPHTDDTFLLFDNRTIDDRLIVKGKSWFLPDDIIQKTLKK